MFLVVQLIVYDALVATDIASTIGKFQHTNAENMKLTDLSKHAWEKLIADGFQIQDSLLTRWLIMASISESIGIEDEIS